MIEKNYHSAGHVLEALSRFDADKLAWFLDVDGTLVFFKDNSADVRLSEEELKNIRILFQKTGQALAIVTGRDHGFIDEILLENNFKPPASFGHGAFIRHHFNGATAKSAAPIDIEKLDRLIRERLQNLPRSIPEEIRPYLTYEKVVEVKEQARALHWKHIPFPEEYVEPFFYGITRSIEREYNEQREATDFVKAEKGRKVYEMGHITATKGHAIKAFMEIEPFKGRTPVYFGDQIADASAMNEAIRHGGIAIGVGPDAPSQANFRVESPAQVHEVIRDINRIWTYRQEDPKIICGL